MKVEDILWTMRDKSKIRLGDMTHSHLANAIKMIEGNITRYECEIDACYGYSGGDMAEMYAEQSADRASEKLYNANQCLRALTAERNRRTNLSTVDDAIDIMRHSLVDS